MAPTSGHTIGQKTQDRVPPHRTPTPTGISNREALNIVEHQKRDHGEEKNPRHDSGLTFVTVVYEPEYTLLKLQARSMRIFLPEGLVHEIIVIDNSAWGMSKDRLSTLRHEYGHLSDRVRILRPRKICSIPPMVGWRSQQILKLEVAKLIDRDAYVVLDAKNHLIDTLQRDFILAPDGRLRVNVNNFEDHPFRPSLERVLTYLCLDPKAYIHCFPVTVTPFTFDTTTVLEMIQGIEDRSGRRFAEEFVLQDLTEFFLYSGWIISRGRELAELYDFHQIFCPMIWPKAADPESCKNALDKASRRGIPFLSVHRGALPNLEPKSIDLLARFWVDRNLFSSTEDAKHWLAECLREIRRHSRIKGLLSGPYRLVTLPWRVKRRLLKWMVVR
ncbi:MAG: hypothetical protein DRJ61_09920 [Acidobacteria bacterium]|nr:MAG: hypothetical protein DRJ61_09920 [Acidobacteriota bacterium]